MGRSRRGRRDGRPDLDGVLIVDKPAGMTSHDVVQVVRRAVGQRRVGHTGTLDPDATGVLVVCLGRATRLVQYLQAGRKTYAATMVLGRETSSQDASGEIVREVDASHVDEHAVCVAMTRFQGDIEQVPPMVSALKVDGERLHEKARRGETVDRDPRPITIHDLVLEDFRGGSAHPEVSFLVTCSAGTYVRTLAHDIGRSLEVGASLTALRRIANGPFTVDDAVALDEVRAAGEDDRIEDLLVTPRAAISALPSVEVDDPDTLLALTQGKATPAHGREGVYAIVHGDTLVGIFRDVDDRAKSELVWLRPEELGGALAGPGTAPSRPAAAHDTRDAAPATPDRDPRSEA